MNQQQSKPISAGYLWVGFSLYFTYEKLKFCKPFQCPMKMLSLKSLLLLIHPTRDF